MAAVVEKVVVHLEMVEEEEATAPVPAGMREAYEPSWYRITLATGQTLAGAPVIVFTGVDDRPCAPHLAARTHRCLRPTTGGPG